MMRSIHILRAPAIILPDHGTASDARWGRLLGGRE